MSARVITVIEVDESRGKGVVGDPFRRVRQYFTADADGRLLAEYDPLQVDPTLAHDVLVKWLALSPIVVDNITKDAPYFARAVAALLRDAEARGAVG